MTCSDPDNQMLRGEWWGHDAEPEDFAPDEADAAYDADLADEGTLSLTNTRMERQ